MRWTERWNIYREMGDNILKIQNRPRREVWEFVLDDPDLFLSPEVTHNSHNQVIMKCLCNLMCCYSDPSIILQLLLHRRRSRDSDRWHRIMALKNCLQKHNDISPPNGLFPHYCLGHTPRKKKFLSQRFQHLLWLNWFTLKVQLQVIFFKNSSVIILASIIHQKEFNLKNKTHPVFGTLFKVFLKCDAISAINFHKIS